MLKPVKLGNTSGISRSCGQIPSSKQQNRRQFIRQSYDNTARRASNVSTNNNNSWIWTPMEERVWKYVTGLRIRLEEIDICKLKEYEFPLIQRLALNRLNEWNLCNDISLRYDLRNPTVLKLVKTQHRSMAKLFHRRSGSQFSLPDIFKFRRKNKSLVFGISISKAMQYDERFYIDSRKNQRRNHSPSLTISSLPIRLNAKSGYFQKYPSLESRLSGSSDFLKASIYNLIVNSNLIPDTVGHKSNENDVGNSRLPQIPLFVQNCLKYLETKCLNVQGIFRVSCSKKRMKQLRDDIDCGKKVYLYDNPSPHDIAGLLKEYFRELPEPLMTDELHQSFLSTRNIECLEAQIKVLNYLLCLLTPTNRNTLQALLNFLHKVTQHSANVTKDNGDIVYGNKMDSRNLAVIFGPNILHSHKLQRGDITKYNQVIMEERKDAIKVIQFMIDNVEKLFKVDADIQNELYIILNNNNPSLLETSFGDRYQMLLKSEEEKICEEDDDDDFFKYNIPKHQSRLSEDVVCSRCSTTSRAHRRKESSPLKNNSNGDSTSGLQHLKSYLLTHGIFHKGESIVSQNPLCGSHHTSPVGFNLSLDPSSSGFRPSAFTRPLVVNQRPTFKNTWELPYTERKDVYYGNKTSAFKTPDTNPYGSLTSLTNSDLAEKESWCHLNQPENSSAEKPSTTEEAESAYSSYDILNATTQPLVAKHAMCSTSLITPYRSLHEDNYLLGEPVFTDRYAPSNRSLPLYAIKHNTHNFVCKQCHLNIQQCIHQIPQSTLPPKPHHKSLALNFSTNISVPDPTGAVNTDKEKNLLKHSLSHCHERVQSLLGLGKPRSHSTIPGDDIPKIEKAVRGKLHHLSWNTTLLPNPMAKLKEFNEPCTTTISQSCHETNLTVSSALTGASPIFLRAPTHSPSNVSSSTCLSLGYESGGLSSGHDVGATRLQDKKKALIKGKNYVNSKLPWQVKVRPLNKGYIYGLSSAMNLRRAEDVKSLSKDIIIPKPPLPQICISKPSGEMGHGGSNLSMMGDDNKDTSTGSLTTTECSVGSSADPSFGGTAEDDDIYEQSRPKTCNAFRCDSPFLTNTVASCAELGKCLKCEKTIRRSLNTSRRHTEQGRALSDSIRIQRRKSLKRRSTLINKMGDALHVSFGKDGKKNVPPIITACNLSDRYKPKETTV